MVRRTPLLPTILEIDGKHTEARQMLQEFMARHPWVIAQWQSPEGHIGNQSQP